MDVVRSLCPTGSKIQKHVNNVSQLDIPFSRDTKNMCDISMKGGTTKIGSWWNKSWHQSEGLSQRNGSSPQPPNMEL